MEAVGHVRTPLTFRGPKLSDPRLHVASVLLTVQVLGQVAIKWNLSIAQVLVSLGTAAAVELAMTVPKTRVVAWPASALLTGNGVALVMRVPGTTHGDWWSMRGWYVFAATAAVSVLSKYAIRVGGRPLFNPSNLGLVLAFLVLGSGIADPQDLWWGHVGPGLIVTYAWIVLGGLTVTRRLRILPISVAFWTVYASLVGVSALLGHTMRARWSLGPVGGAEYWWNVALSPEVLIFVFFMITDPRTAARGRVGATVYAAAVGAVSAGLIAAQSTEFATKVALLAGLVIVCAVRPLIERSTADAPSVGAWLRGSGTVAGSVAFAAIAAFGISAVGGAFAGAGSIPASAVTARAAATEQITLAADQRPTVTLGDGFAGVGGTFGQADAERVADQTVRAVLAVDSAIERSDRARLDILAGGRFHEQVMAESATTAPRRTFRTAAIDVVRNPGEFQAIPRIAVTFTGTVDGRPSTTTYHVLATDRSVRIDREIRGA